MLMTRCYVRRNGSLSGFSKHMGALRGSNMWLNLKSRMTIALQSHQITFVLDHHVMSVGKVKKICCSALSLALSMAGYIYSSNFGIVLVGAGYVGKSSSSSQILEVSLSDRALHSVSGSV